MDAMSSNKILPGSCAAAGLSSADHIFLCYAGSLLSLILFSLFSHPDLFPLVVQSISIPVILIVPFPVILSEAKDLFPLHLPYLE